MATKTSSGAATTEKVAARRQRCCAHNQGWQYGTVRSEFAYYVPRTLNRTVPAYRTSVQFLKRTVPFQKRRTVPAYRTSEQKLKRNVPYQRTVPYCHSCFQLLATLTDFEITSL